MICLCGADLGKVTMKTTGLCESCGRSKWLQVCHRTMVKGVAIAEGLNRRHDRRCVHNTTACFTRCGVILMGYRWEPIAEVRRQIWFKEVNRIGLKEGRLPI